MKSTAPAQLEPRFSLSLKHPTAAHAGEGGEKVGARPVKTTRTVSAGPLRAEGRAALVILSPSCWWAASRVS